MPVQYATLVIAKTCSFLSSDYIGCGVGRDTSISTQRTATFRYTSFSKKNSPAWCFFRASAKWGPREEHHKLGVTKDKHGDQTVQNEAIQVIHKADEYDKKRNSTLDDVFISVKTSKKFHESRVSLQLETWFNLAREQVGFNSTHKFLLSGSYFLEVSNWKVVIFLEVSNERNLFTDDQIISNY